MEKLGEEIFEENALPQNVKTALDEIDQIFGKSEGIVTELGEVRIQLKHLRRELAKCKNVKNHRLVSVNAKINEKRNEIRRRIAVLMDREEELKIEHEGKNSS